MQRNAWSSDSRLQREEQIMLIDTKEANFWELWEFRLPRGTSCLWSVACAPPILQTHRGRIISLKSLWGIRLWGEELPVTVFNMKQHSITVACLTFSG